MNCDLPAGDGFNEDQLENLLRDSAEAEAMVESLGIQGRDNDARVLASLREQGMNLNVPANLTMSLFQYGQLLETLVASEEAVEGESGERRKIALIFHAQSISSTMDFLSDVHRDGTNEATEHKIAAQFEILEDDIITELDKAQLLDVLDAMAPVDGIDFTDPAVFDRLREQSESEIEIEQLRMKCGQVINDLVKAELVPAFGEHDEYEQFKTQLRHWLVLQKRMASAGESAEHLQMLADHDYSDMVRVAGTIGIPDDALETFIAKVDSHL